MKCHQYVILKHSDIYWYCLIELSNPMPTLGHPDHEEASSMLNCGDNVLCQLIHAYEAFPSDTVQHFHVMPVCHWDCCKRTAHHMLTLFKIYLGLVSWFLHAGLLSMCAIIIKIKLVMMSNFVKTNFLLSIMLYIFRILCGILKII